MTLLDVQQGEKAIITKVRGRGAFRRRIIEMGFVKGQEVKTIKYASVSLPIIPFSTASPTAILISSSVFGTNGISRS